ncbi:hypothetical protein E4K10_38785 [Streptomyces sp. T1317-0309]|nr:hypothetical protein E4K10_38785 [Streptomyces sp. T1317-0309]
MVAGAHTGDPAVREADAVRDAGERLTHSVRDLQRNGDGVLLISRNRHALRAADVGVGLTGPKGAPPWGADIYVKGGDLAAALLLVRACRGARESARRGVRLAQAAAGVGATAVLADGRRGPRSAASRRSARRPRSVPSSGSGRRRGCCVVHGRRPPPPVIPGMRWPRPRCSTGPAAESKG